MKTPSALRPFLAALVAGVLAAASTGGHAAGAGVAQAPEVLNLGTATLVTPARVEQAAASLNPGKSQTRHRRRSADRPVAEATASLVFEGGGKAAKAPAPVPPTQVGPVFNGTNNNSGLLSDPPDTAGAAGFDYFVEIVNTRVQVFQTYANGQTLARPVLKRSSDHRAFFGVPQLADGDVFDGRVLFDSKQNRWIFVAADSSDFNRAQLVLAVSKTGDPLGAYYRYRYSIPPSSAGGANFWDFPMLGQNKDTIFISGDMYAGDSYVSSALLSIPKSIVYQGKPLSGAFFKNLAGTLAVPVVLDSNTNAFFVAAQDGRHLHLLKGTNLGNVSQARVALQSKITVPAYEIPDPAAQPNTIIALDSSDFRFVNASTQNGNFLWNIHTIKRNGHANPKFYKIDTGLNKVAQSGFFARSGSSDDFNASLAVNAFGDVFVTWTSVNAAAGVYPSVVFSGFAAGQYSNVPAITQGKVMATSRYAYLGDYNYQQRWGDYSAVSLDPRAYGTCAAGRRAWIVNEKVNSEDAWGSTVGRIGFC